MLARDASGFAGLPRRLLDLRDKILELTIAFKGVRRIHITGNPRLEFEGRYSARQT
jgi:hypothetical protein